MERGRPAAGLGVHALALLQDIGSRVKLTKDPSSWADCFSTALAGASVS